MPRAWKGPSIDSSRWRVPAVAAALVLGLGVGVAACGQDEESGGSTAGGASAESKKVRVAYLVATEAAGYPQGMLKAARAAASGQNVELEVFDAQFNPQKQVSQCQDAIASGSFDGLIALPAASPPMIACAAQAKAKEIPLVATNTPIGDDLGSETSDVPGVTSQVLIPAERAFGTGPDDGAGQLLPSLCEQVEGKCKIAFILGVRALALTQVADANVKKIVDANPDMELVGTCEGGYQRAGGLKCMQDVLQKDKDVNVLLSLSDDMAIGAEGAMKKAGKTPGEDVFVGTQGGSVQGIENIRSGRWFGSILSLAEPEGRIPVELVAKAARGEQVEPYVNPNEATGAPLVLDQGNKDEYPALQGQFEG